MISSVSDRPANATGINILTVKCRDVLLVVVAMAVWAMPGAPALATVNDAQICDSAAQDAARRTGVPMAVLLAISLTETGRQSDGTFRPWPWTVNMEGKGVWFDSRRQALDFVAQNYRRGARSFDVGCFQLNYKWHGQAFSSVEQMFDPTENALYAARYLRDLFAEKGNWIDAAGAYHSRTPKFANRYKKRFKDILAGLSRDLPDFGNRALVALAPSVQSSIPQAVVRLNTFPLLTGGATRAASLGSLMPASAGRGAPRLLGGS